MHFKPKTQSKSKNESHRSSLKRSYRNKLRRQTLRSKLILIRELFLYGLCNGRGCFVHQFEPQDLSQNVCAIFTEERKLHPLIHLSLISGILGAQATQKENLDSTPFTLLSSSCLKVLRLGFCSTTPRLVSQRGSVSVYQPTCSSSGWSSLSLLSPIFSFLSTFSLPVGTHLLPQFRWASFFTSEWVNPSFLHV